MPPPAVTPGQARTPIESTDAPPAEPARVNPAGPSLDECRSRWRDELTARGCRPGSVDRMLTTVRTVGEWNGWTHAGLVDYAGAVAFLAHKRRGVDGKAGWSGPTYDQAVSTLRTFGEFLRRSKITTANPLVDLQACGQPGNQGTRALGASEAAALIEASLDRHLASRRAKGCAPLVWLFMLHTGLRYAECEACRWGDLVLDDEPAVWTDPAWIGNKAQRRDRIPLHPVTLAQLRDYRGTVPHGPKDLVFPVMPNRATFQRAREGAGIPERDARRRPVSPHSLRKTFCTLLDAQAIPRGLVSKLARHAETLTEARYIDHAADREREAVEALPQFWPSGLKIFSIGARKSLASLGRAADTGNVTPSESSPMLESSTSNHALPAALHSAGGGVTTPSLRAGESIFSARLGNAPVSAPAFAVEDGNGHSRSEKPGALIHGDPLDRVLSVLVVYAERRLGMTRAGEGSPAHGPSEQQQAV